MRGCDADGTPVIPDRIKADNGFIYAQVACQDELGSRLDELVKMVLDDGLHEDSGVAYIISGTSYFLN